MVLKSPGSGVAAAENVVRRRQKVDLDWARVVEELGRIGAG